MTLKLWLHGLMAAAISGLASATGGSIGATVAGLDVFSPVFWKVTGGAAIGGALVAVVGYLKQSPLPPLSGER